MALTLEEMARMNRELAQVSGGGQAHSQVRSRRPEYANEELHGMNSQNPLALLVQYLTSQGNQTPQNLAALRNDPQGDANKSYIPGSLNGANNPFAGGFFQNNPSGQQGAATFSGGFQDVDPATRMRTAQQQQMAGVVQAPGQVIPEQIQSQPLYPALPPNPGFGSSQWPDYQRQVLAQGQKKPRSPFAY